MDDQTLDTILDKWKSDPEFRAQVRAQPDTAIESLGITLDDSQKAALSNVPWHLSDDELADWARGPLAGAW